MGLPAKLSITYGTLLIIAVKIIELVQLDAADFYTSKSLRLTRHLNRHRTISHAISQTPFHHLSLSFLL
jgi:hypothetical protein